MSRVRHLLLPLVLLVACVEAAPVPVKKTVKISPWNVGKLREISVVDKDVWSIVWRRDGREVAFVSWEQPVEILDGKSLRPLRKIGGADRLIHFDYHPDRERVAYCKNGRDARLVNLRTKEVVALPAGNSQPAMRFSPNGRWLATGGYGTMAKIWCGYCGEFVRAVDAGPTEGGLTVEFSPDSKTLAVGNRNSTTRLFDVATGRLLHELPHAMSHGLKFGPGGQTLAIAYVDGSLRLWDVASGSLVRTGKVPAEELYTLDWSPDGDLLATAGLRSAVTLWEPGTLRVLKQLKAPDWVISLRFSPDGTRLVGAGGASGSKADRKLRVWAVR